MLTNLLLVTILAAQSMDVASVDSAGVQGNWNSRAPALSADGRFVAFESDASNLVAGDGNYMPDIFVHDRGTVTTERVSVSSSGGEGNWGGSAASISADGRFVAFRSFSDNLVTGDGNGKVDLFVRDRQSGTTTRVSIDSAGGEADANSENPAISGDGNWVAFSSDATNLVAGDTNGVSDVFLHDRSTGTTTRASVSGAGAEGNWESLLPSISFDGGLVVFTSLATNLVASDWNGNWDVFVHERVTGETTRVSVDSNGAEGNNYSQLGKVSADGSCVAFGSGASNLVPNDTNARWDVFLHELGTDVTTRVSVDSNGVEANDGSGELAISGDGDVVAFESLAGNLVPGDGNGVMDVFLHERRSGRTLRASVSDFGVEGDQLSRWPSLSADGRSVAFESSATTLVAEDFNGFADAFVLRRFEAWWCNFGSGLAGTNGIPALTCDADPILGTTITVDLSNSAGAATIAVAFLGFEDASIPAWGAALLLVPTFVVPLPLSATGLTADVALPDDDLLLSLAVLVQAIELDSGAPRGVSFTRGLELMLGR